MPAADLGKQVTSPRDVAPADRSARKWIRRRIESLDPHVDYEEIWALTSLYNVDAFDLHWEYALSFPHLIVTKWGAEVSYRDGEGWIIVQADKRVVDTNDHMMVYSEHGPDSPVSKKSAEIVNKMHAHVAEQYPGRFSYADDYMYFLCSTPTSMHSLRRSLGLPGFSEKQKIAAHIFWSKMASLFTVEDGTKVTDAVPAPESFEGMMAFCEEYESRSWPANPVGAAATRELVEHFASEWFPRPLRPFGRALVTSFFAPSLFQAFEMPQPHPASQMLARTYMRTRILFKQYLRPDDKESFTDRRRRLAATGRAGSSAVDWAVHRAVFHDGPMTGCPHRSVPTPQGPRRQPTDQPDQKEE